MARIPLGPADDAAEQWVADWTASISQRAAAARELSEQVADLTATAEGGRGAVRVTVASSGVLTDLKLDKRVLQWSPEKIADEILTASRRAQGKLAAQVAAVAAGTVGADSETSRTVVGSFTRRFPPVPEEDPHGDDTDRETNRERRR